MGIAEIFESIRKLGARNTTVMLDFKTEVEIQQFCACTIKIMQYNAFFWLHC